MVRYTFEMGIMPEETAHSGTKVRQKASVEVLGQDQCQPRVGGEMKLVSSRAISLDRRELISVEHEHK
jgi:hypothetical protein